MLFYAASFFSVLCELLFAAQQRSAKTKSPSFASFALFCSEKSPHSVRSVLIQSALMTNLFITLHFRYQSGFIYFFKKEMNQSDYFFTNKRSPGCLVYGGISSCSVFQQHSVDTRDLTQDWDQTKPKQSKAEFPHWP